MVDSPFAAKIKTGSIFILLTMLQEKWPVESQTKFEIIASRLNADLSDSANACSAVRLNNPADQAALKLEETN